MIKLVAFDWNGTLLADTLPIYQADAQVCKFLNLRIPTFKEFTEVFDIPVKNYYIHLGAKEKDLLAKAQAIENIFHNFYEQRIKSVRTRAHTKPLLNYLKEEKINALIFSNHLKEKISEQLLKFKIDKYFDVVLGNTDMTTAFKKRAKNEMLKQYLDNQKIKPSEVLIVGDTIEEIHIARQIGTKVASITHGNCSTKRLKEAKPDYLISNLLEIENILKLNS